MVNNPQFYKIYYFQVYIRLLIIADTKTKCWRVVIEGKGKKRKWERMTKILVFFFFLKVWMEIWVVGDEDLEEEIIKININN